MSKLKIDLEFEALIPSLTPEEFTLLEQSIVRDGCRHPLVVWNDILVDGHNRYKICTQHGLPFKTTKLERFDSRESVELWIIDNQLGRRNVIDYQRAELALKKEAIIAARAKHNMEAGTNQHSSPSTNLSKGTPVDTRREIAKAAGLSEGTVAKVKKIQAHAIEEVIEAARVGEIKIDAAAAIATLPAEDQLAIAAKGKVAMKSAAKLVRATMKQKRATPSRAQSTESVDISALSVPAPATSTGDDVPAPLGAENAELPTPVAESAAMLEHAQTGIIKVGEAPQVDDPLAAALADVKRLTAYCTELENRLADLQAEYDALVFRDIVHPKMDCPEPEQPPEDGEESVGIAQPEHAEAVAQAPAACSVPVAQLDAGPA